MRMSEFVDFSLGFTSFDGFSDSVQYDGFRVRGKASIWG